MPSPLRSRSCAGTARAHPLHLVAIPLVAFLLLAGASVAGCVAGAASLAATSRAALQQTAGGAAYALAVELDEALAPLVAIRTVIEDGAGGAANHSAVIAYWAAARARLVASTPAVACLQLAPYGRVAAIYPLVLPGLNLTGVIAAGGLDLLNASNGLINHRPAAIGALASGAAYAQGPQTVFACVGATCSASVSPTLALIVRLPLYVPSAAAPGAADVWAGGAVWPGVPGGAPVGPFTAATNCTLLAGAAPGTTQCDANGVLAGRKFWGYATTILKWDTMLSQAGITKLGPAAGVARWSVARSPPGGGAAWLPATSSGGVPLPTDAYAGGVVGAATSRAGVAFAVTLEPVDALFQPPWFAPLLAGLIVFSFAFSITLVAYNWSTMLYNDLLFSALPARVVKSLAVSPCGGAAKGESGALFAESFEHVTIVFCDIVGFTELVSRIEPRETMLMLSSLFARFDAITLKYGAAKVETIGDAYLVVVGTAGPLAGDAAGQARAAAALALDFIDAAGAQVAPDGSQLRIRAGAHCGPIVAGVVGLLMPHWSPFGDTVNFASRMEAASRPSRLLVSAALGALVARDGAFAVTPRKSVAIKGRGVQDTAWVRRAADAPPLDDDDGAEPPGATSTSGASASGSAPLSVRAPAGSPAV
jgi:class 3 adenylate cyclase